MEIISSCNIVRFKDGYMLKTSRLWSVGCTTEASPHSTIESLFERLLMFFEGRYGKIKIEIATDTPSDNNNSDNNNFDSTFISRSSDYPEEIKP